MILQFSSIDDLPYVGRKGDVAIVDDGTTRTSYNWLHGTWRHETNYVCPVKETDLLYEPNV